MVAQSSLKHHRSSQHGICVPQTRGVDEKGEGPDTYVMSFPGILQSVRCPVPGCPAVCHSAGRLREHFMFRHFRSRILVVQKVKEPLPSCNMCGMHMPAGRIISHHRTARCDRNTQMQLRIRDVDIAAKCTWETFSLMGVGGAEFLEGVDSFKYLGCVLHRADKDLPAVCQDIGRARQIWEQLGGF